MRPMKPNRLLDAVVQRIVSTEFGPGKHLTAAGLAELLGTSRTPIRECLRSLEALGLVEVHGNRGAFVVDPATIEPAEIYDLVETRAQVEPFLMGQAARRRTEVDIGRIDAALSDGDTAMASGDAGGLNIAHHRLLESMLTAAHNDPAAQALRPLHHRTCLIVARSAPITLPEGWREHRLVRDAIEARDAEGAADLHRRHLDQVLSSLAG